MSEHWFRGRIDSRRPGHRTGEGRPCQDRAVDRAARYKPAAKRRWGYYALPILHDDRLVGKVDANADRKASVLRVHAIHEDVRFTRTMTKAVQNELEDLASWLGLAAVEPN